MLRDKCTSVATVTCEHQVYEVHRAQVELKLSSRSGHHQVYRSHRAPDLLSSRAATHVCYTS
eukprot:4560864-Prymnesium_polylepis.1